MHNCSEHVDNQTADSESEAPAHWVVWNGTAGLLIEATTGRVEVDVNGRKAWLEPPFDMVGPFNLDELERHGRIAFAACVVMSRQRWQRDQVELRRAAHAKRRAAQERLNHEYQRFNADWGRDQRHHRPFDQRLYREILNLPVDGELEPSQIKAAFRRLAQKLHPDVGGSHEQFVRITEARNALLERNN